MKSNFMKMMGLLITALLILSTSYCYLRADVEDTLTRSFDVAEGGKLVLDTDIGSIEVESGSKDKIRVKVFRKVRASSQKKVREVLNDFQIDFKQEGKNLFHHGRDAPGPVKVGHVWRGGRINSGHMGSGSGELVKKFHIHINFSLIPDGRQVQGDIG